MPMPSERGGSCKRIQRIVSVKVNSKSEPEGRLNWLTEPEAIGK